MLVATRTPISSRMKNNTDMFIACGEDKIFYKGKILVFRQYLDNESVNYMLKLTVFKLGIIR